MFNTLLRYSHFLHVPDTYGSNTPHRSSLNIWQYLITYQLDDYKKVRQLWIQIISLFNENSQIFGIDW